MQELNIHLLSLQADSPDAKDELACLETEHQNTLREVSREGNKDLNSTDMTEIVSVRLACFVRHSVQ